MIGINSDTSQNITHLNTDETLGNFCIFGPHILEIIETDNQNELSVDILESKLTDLKQLDALTFFCGEKGNYIDNAGAHIWFVENYTNIIEACSSPDDKIATLAKTICSLLEKFIKQNTTNQEGLIIPSIKGAKEDIGQFIIHGFVGEGVESGNEEFILSRKGFTREEVAKILQNN